MLSISGAGNLREAVQASPNAMEEKTMSLQTYAALIMCIIALGMTGLMWLTGALA
jgi:hypothetical protein